MMLTGPGFRLKGFTVIEMLVAVVIFAVVVTVAVPNFISFLQNSRLSAAAQDLFFNLNNAKTQAIRANNNVYVSFVMGSSWCYGINLGSACNCSTPVSCSLGTGKASGSTVSLSSTGLSGGSMIFEPNHGASSTNATLTFTGGSRVVKVKIGLFGNVQTCSDDLSGFQRCT